MATQSNIQLAPDSSGKKVDTTVTTTAAQHRQVMVLGDPAVDGNLVSVSSAGTIPVENRSATIQTYAANSTGLVPAGSATDILTITGSATKTVKIKRIIINGTQTTSSTKLFIVLKRSAADSGGTSTTLTIVPHDSQNSVATAVVKSYTANPTTLGTLVGNLITQIITIPIASLASDYRGWDFSTNSELQPLVLRNTSENICINLNGVSITGGLLNISIIWTEE